MVGHHSHWTLHLSCYLMDTNFFGGRKILIITIAKTAVIAIIIWRKPKFVNSFSVKIPRMHFEKQKNHWCLEKKSL